MIKTIVIKKTKKSGAGRSIFVFLGFVMVLLSCNNYPDGEINEREILSTFEMADGFQIELFAAEPLISDPVAMEIDEEGRVYVVEMHGYPLDKSGSGKVKLLSDTKGDGLMDHSVTFADDLLFPTGIMRWKKGVLVTDPPNVLYFEDMDGDGVADIRDTILTGFAVSNPQHNFNTPIFGLDNWIYISNEPAVAARVFKEEFGDLGSEVRFYGMEDGPVLRQNAGGLRIRMIPEKGALEYTSSRGQFGQSYDQWGRHFLVSNANHIFQEVIQAEYLNRNPSLLISSSTDNISDHGNAAKVYPITENPEYQLLTDIGVFTSACGNAVYTGGLFPEEYTNSVFVCEPVSNIVHVDRVESKGASFSASRMVENKEFMASEDAWFRPVNHYIGPDGALYVLDYYRKIIEHPEWMGEDAINSGELYHGRDQGRIFRVTPEGTAPASWTRDLNMNDLTEAELISYLKDRNSWYRKNAQRLLLDRNTAETVPALKGLIEEEEGGIGRLHAAWTLEGLDELDAGDVLRLLEDPVAGIRENGVKLSEKFLEDEEIIRALLALQSDEDSRLRFQLLCTLGFRNTGAINAARVALIEQDIADPWMQTAALSASDPELSRLLEVCHRNYDRNPSAYGAFARKIVAMIAGEGNTAEVRSLIRTTLRRGSGHNKNLSAAILQGLSDGGRNIDFRSAEFTAERSMMLDAVMAGEESNLRNAAMSLVRQMGLPGDAGEITRKAVSVVRDQTSEDADKIFAIQILSLSGGESVFELMEGLLTPAVAVAVQAEALRAMYQIKGTAFLRSLIDQWQELSPRLRSEAVKLLLRDKDGMTMLVDALEAGVVDPSNLQWSQQVGMMAQADDDLRRRSRAIFTQESSDEDKKKLLEKYRPATGADGDLENGLMVFKTQCALCHQLGGKMGTDYGPDLATIQNRRKSQILQDILDPGLSIADGYDLWEIELKNGETKQGIIGSESSISIDLRVLDEENEVIPRSEIVRITAKNISAMPMGLESVIGVEDMRDLLTFIKKID